MAIAAVDAVPAPPGIAVRVQPASGPILRPARIIEAALLLLVIGNLGRVPVTPLMASGAAGVTLNDGVVLAILATGLLAGLRARTWRLDAPGMLALAFAAVGGFSALLAIPRFNLSVMQVAYSLAYLVRWLAYFGIYLVAINTLRAGDVGPVWGALEAAMLAFALFGIFQSLFLPGFAQLVQPDAGWDLQGRRLVSTFLDPNMAGALLDIGALVTLARLSAGVPVPRWKPLVLLAALLLTLSRGSLVGFLAGGAVILAARGLSRRLVKLAAAVAVLTLPFVPALVALARTFNKFDIGASALGKVPFYLRAITVFLDHPVLGVGFNTYGFVQRAYGWEPHGVQGFGVDGGLLLIALLTGVVGLIPYVGMIWLVLRRSRRTWRDRARSPQDRGLAIGVAAATVAVVVHSVFANSLLLPLIMEPLWVLWALTLLIATPSRGPDPAPPAPVVLSLARVN